MYRAVPRTASSRRGRSFHCRLGLASGLREPAAKPPATKRANKSGSQSRYPPWSLSQPSHCVGGLYRKRSPTQARALPTSLVVKNGSKMCGKTSGGFTSSIRNTQPNKISRRRLGVLARVILVEFHRVGSYHQPAASRHGVARITTRFSNTCSSMPRPPNDRQFASELLFQPDILADDPLEHPGHVGDGVVQVYGRTWSTCLRLKARSCRVNSAARKTAMEICCAESEWSAPSPLSINSTWAWPEMMESRLLKSWPPRRPTGRQLPFSGTAAVVPRSACAPKLANLGAHSFKQL